MSARIGFGFVVGLLYSAAMLWVMVDHCRQHSPTGECSIRMDFASFDLEPTKHTGTGISQ